MIKRKIRLERALKMKWLLAVLLLTCSCSEELSHSDITEYGIPLELSVSLDPSGFTTDSEVVPMGTRAGAKSSHVVTRIFTSTLFILKKTDAGWVVMDQKRSVLDTPNHSSALIAGDALSLKTADANYVMLPGTYQFVLLVNAIVPEIPKYTLIDENSPLAASTSFPYGDFFSAKSTIVLSKKTELDQENENSLKLSLVRNSDLLRFIIEGDDLRPIEGINTTIYYTISNNGALCAGVNIFGDMVTIDKEIKVKLGTEIVHRNSYLVNDKSWTFSESELSNPSPSLYADEVERRVTVEVTAIGNERLNQYKFEGSYVIENVPVKKNKITTILIRKKENTIAHDLNPSVADWNATYPPFNYVELNNKTK